MPLSFTVELSEILMHAIFLDFDVYHIWEVNPSFIPQSYL